MISIESPIARLSFGTLGWKAEFSTGEKVEAGWPQLHYRWGGRSFSGPENWEFASPSTLEGACPAHGLRLRWTFTLPAQSPLVLWQLEVWNEGNQPLFMDRFDLLPPATQFTLHPSLAPEPVFFANGWQSWSYSGLYGPQDRQKRTRLGPFRTPTEGHLLPARLPQGQFQAEMFGALADRRSRRGLLAGFTAQEQQFGSWRISLRRPPIQGQLLAHGDAARLDPGFQACSDPAALQPFCLDDPDPWQPFLSAVGERQLGTACSAIPTGWCSWYAYSSEDYVGRLNAADLRENLQAAQELRPTLPLEVFQIDDGFERWVGDWNDFTPGFPGGVAPLPQEIQEAGFRPGLWLAPFIADPRSALAQRHPTWLLRHASGRPVSAGFLWNRFAAGLDLTHPDALDFAAQTVATAVQRWGYSYLKLDFLYAAALPGLRFDPTRSRAQALRRGLETVRAAAGGDTFLLGCGCPLGTAVGTVNAMRIGTDTSARWEPAFRSIQTFFRKEPNLPAARLAAQSAVRRAALHRHWWINDPDCLLLDSANELTLAEVRTVASVIAMTGGSLLLSDRLTRLSAERSEIAARLLPLIGQRPQVLDFFDSPYPSRLRLDLNYHPGSWSLLTLINWEDHPVQATLERADWNLEAGEYGGYEFWNKSPLNWDARSSALELGWLEPHSCRALALRPLQAPVQWIGSSLHFSQGLEVCTWEVAENQLAFQLERPGPSRGEVVLRLPSGSFQAQLNRRPIFAKAEPGSLYRFPVEFDQQAKVLITW